LKNIYILSHKWYNWYYNNWYYYFCRHY